MLTRVKYIAICQTASSLLYCATYLSDTGITDPDDVEESGHDLGQELDTLEAQRLKDEGDSLDHHSMVIGERGVSQDSHQCDDCHSRVELIKGKVAHVH